MSYSSKKNLTQNDNIEINIESSIEHLEDVKYFIELLKSKDRIQVHLNHDKQLLEELKQKQIEKQKEIGDHLNDISEIERNLEKISDIETTKVLASIIDVDNLDKLFYIAMRDFIRQHMNISNSLTVWDFIAYNIASSKPWDNGLSADSNGKILAHEPWSYFSQRLKLRFIEALIYYFNEETKDNFLINDKSVRRFIMKNKSISLYASDLSRKANWIYDKDSK